MVPVEAPCGWGEDHVSRRILKGLEVGKNTNSYLVQVTLSPPKIKAPGLLPYFASAHSIGPFRRETIINYCMVF